MSNYNINFGSTKLFVSSSDSKLQCPICGLQFTTKEEKDYISNCNMLKIKSQVVKVNNLEKERIKFKSGNGAFD